MFTRRYLRSRGFTQIEIFIIVLIIGILAAIAAPSFGGMLEAARMNQATAELRNAFQETQRYAIRQNTACQTNVFIPGSSSKASQIQGTCLATGNRALPKGIGIATNVRPIETRSSSSLLDETSRSSSSLSELPPNLQITRASLVGDTTCALSDSLCSNDDDDDEDSSNRSSSSNSNSSSSGSSSSSSSGSSSSSSSGSSSSSSSGSSGSSSSGSSGSSSSSGSSDSGRIAPDIEVQIGFGRLGAANFELAQSQSSSATSGDPSAKFISYRHKSKDGKKSCIVISRSLGLTRIGKYEGELSPSQITATGQCRVNTWSEQ